MLKVLDLCAFILDFYSIYSLKKDEIRILNRHVYIMPE